MYFENIKMPNNFSYLTQSVDTTQMCRGKKKRCCIQKGLKNFNNVPNCDPHCFVLQYVKPNGRERCCETGNLNDTMPLFSERHP